MSADELRHKARHVYLNFVLIFGSILGVILLVMLYWLLRPYDNISFTPFETNQTEYRNGDVISMTDEFCWDGTPFTVRRFFVSPISKISAGTVEFPNGYALPAVEEKFGQGCAPSTVRVDIPPSIPPGEWAIAYEVSFRANPVRTIELSNTSNTFTVLSPDSE